VKVRDTKVGGKSEAEVEVGSSSRAISKNGSEANTRNLGRSRMDMIVLSSSLG
jgi:hypothetical protein